MDPMKLMELGKVKATTFVWTWMVQVVMIFVQEMSWAFSSLSQFGGIAGGLLRQKETKRY